MRGATPRFVYFSTCQPTYFHTYLARNQLLFWGERGREGAHE